MTTSDTPETDAAVISSNGQWSFVLKETCRRIERERNEWAAMCGRYKQERDEANDKMVEAECSVREIASVMEKVQRERDEARKELEEYRSIAENIGAEKAISEKEKAIRERDETKEEIKRLRYEAQIEAEHHDCMIGEFEKVYSERDELKEKYDKLATEHMLAVNKLAQERDEARAQIDDYRKRHDLLPISWEL